MGGLWHPESTLIAIDENILTQELPFLNQILIMIFGFAGLGFHQKWGLNLG